MRPSARFRPAAAAPALGIALGAALALAAPDATAQVTPGDTGTTARPVPPWERRGGVGLAAGGAGLYQTRRGADAGPGLGNGGGFDAFGAVTVSAFALAVGYQQSGFGIQTPGTGRVTDRVLFVEPRLSLLAFRNFNVYSALRGGVVRRAVPGSARYAAETQTLTTYGAGLGTLVSVAPGVSLDLGLYGLNVTGGGREGPAVVPGPFLGGTGWSWGVRGGVAVGFDRWNR